MAVFLGTILDDTINPSTTSVGVVSLPVGQRPSGAADTILGYAGGDKIDGGGGNDLIRAGSEVDDGNPLSDRDTVHGGSGDDTIYGGEDGDTLFGDQNSDTLFGGLGQDTLVGGTGHDTMTGGDGFDKYQFDKAADSVVGANRDVVGIDVSGVGVNLGDQIDFHGLVAGSLTFKGTGAFTGVNQVRVVDQAGTDNTIVQVNLSGDAKPEMEILALDGDAKAAKWASTDFVL